MTEKLVEEPKKNNPLFDFVSVEIKRLEKQRQDYLKEHGMEEFIQWPIGATGFTLLKQLPRSFKGNFGERVAFRVKVDGKDWDWSVNPLSPIYGDLIRRLVEGSEGTLIRIGTGKSTRYEIAWK